MTILTDSTSAQTFKVIPRQYPALVSFSITDRNLDTTVNYTGITPVYSYGWMEITESLSLVEGRTYVLEIKSSSDVIYRGQIYCTNQTDYSKFQITSGSTVTSDDKDNTIILF
jgi:hypothetical protein